MELNDIIIKPYHTEKSYGLRKMQDPSCIAFMVNKKANKYEIKSAFKSIYNIEPEKINITNRKAKRTKTGTQHPGYTKQFKIAYIILPAGVQLAITKDELEEAAKAKSEQTADSKVGKESSTKKDSKDVETKETKSKEPVAKESKSKAPVSKEKESKKAVK